MMISAAAVLSNKNKWNWTKQRKMYVAARIALTLNGSQLAKMKKSIPDMSLP